MVSPPTDRVLDIVELLARSGSTRLRFSDVVRELGLTQATTHAILATLTDRGWVVRDPVSKGFSLGPALAATAARATAGRPQAQAAATAVRRLSDELGCAASVVERIGDTLVISAFEGAGHHTGSGDRIPYTPPFGVAFAAWDTPAGQRAWIDRGAAGNRALGRRLAEALAQTRARGYDVDWTTPALTEAARVVGTLPSDGLPPQIREIMDRLLVEFTTVGILSGAESGGRSQPVATIAAPVFGADGTVALLVAAHPLRAMTSAEVDTVGQHLVAQAAALHL